VQAYERPSQLSRLGIESPQGSFGVSPQADNQPRLAPVVVSAHTGSLSRPRDLVELCLAFEVHRQFM